MLGIGRDFKILLVMILKRLVERLKIFKLALTGGFFVICIFLLLKGVESIIIVLLWLAVFFMRVNLFLVSGVWISCRNSLIDLVLRSSHE